MQCASLFILPEQSIGIYPPLWPCHIEERMVCGGRRCTPTGCPQGQMANGLGETYSNHLCNPMNTPSGLYSLQARGGRHCTTMRAAHRAERSARSSQRSRRCAGGGMLVEWVKWGGCGRGAHAAAGQGMIWVRTDLKPRTLGQPLLPAPPVPPRLPPARNSPPMPPATTSMCYSLAPWAPGSAGRTA